MAVYLIGDLQGCDEPLARLLHTLDFSPSRDTLYLLGDLVNRGPDSLGVLRRVQALEPAGVGARSVAECLLLQLSPPHAPPHDTPAGAPHGGCVVSGPLDFEDKAHHLTVHVQLAGDRGEWTGDEYTIDHDDCATVERYEDMYVPACFTAASADATAASSSSRERASMKPGAIGCIAAAFRSSIHFSISRKSQATRRGVMAKRRGNSPRFSMSRIVLSDSGTMPRSCLRLMSTFPGFFISSNVRSRAFISGDPL